ncbi:MAG: DUF2157 domain-containing protein [bacterium]|nr:DUF2157 domain-containing protein [bacterium]
MYSIIGILFWLVIIYIIVRKFIGYKRKHYDWLQKQIITWENGKLISTEQGTAILASYNLKRVDPARKLDTIKILTLIGAIFVGVGIIFMVASNWQEIPKIVRTAMLLGLTLGTLYTGYYVSYERTDYPLLGKSLFLLAGLFWGGSIALITQIYNIPTSKNWFIFLLWAFPILPVAYFFKNEYTYVLSSALFLIWDITYSTSNNTANYYYLVLVFLLLLPIARIFIKWEWVNVLSLVMAAVSAVFLKQDYFILTASAGLLVYYLWVKKQEIFLLAAALCFPLWLIAFFMIRQATPNFYFLLPLTLLFYLSYKAKSQVAASINLASAVLWINLVLAAYLNITRQSYNIISFSLLHFLVGSILFTIGMLHKGWYEEYVPLYKISGFALCSIFAYLLAFKQVYTAALPAPGLFFFSSQAALVLLILLAAIAGWQGYFNHKNGKLELIGLLLSVSGAVLILLNPAQPLLNTVVANFILVVFAVLCVFSGVEAQDPLLFNCGVAFFVLFIITRYIDIFWKLQEKSIFFLVSGIILIFSGMYLEKKRRQIIERMKG